MYSSPYRGQYPRGSSNQQQQQPQPSSSTAPQQASGTILLQGRSVDEIKSEAIKGYLRDFRKHYQPGSTSVTNSNAADNLFEKVEQHGLVSRCYEAVIHRNLDKPHDPKVIETMFGLFKFQAKLVVVKGFSLFMPADETLTVEEVGDVRAPVACLTERNGKMRPYGIAPEWLRG